MFLQLLATVPPLNHDEILIFLGQLTLLLGVARLLGEFMRKLDQPAVIGELLAGLLIGPSVLGQMAPSIHSAIFPAEQRIVDLLSMFSLVGVLMLLIVTGLEIDLGLIARRIRTATYVSLGGLVVPFVFGFGLGYALPIAYLVKPGDRLVFSLFMAVCMSISAIPVIAKVLMDLKAIRRDIGQVTLAAAMIDDAVGWCLLSVAAGLAAKGEISFQDASYGLLMSVLVMTSALWFGRNWVHKILTKVDRTFGGEASQLSLVVFIALGLSCLTHGLGLEAMLGAFLAGILVGQSPRLKSQVAHSLELFTASFFAPIFFASAGLKVNLGALFSYELAGLTLIVCAVATVGKYAGCYIGGWLGGLSHWERLCLGSGMNPRGAMGVIVASIGLSLGILNTDTYSVLVAMAILTSLAAPPLLRWSLSHVEVTDEEARRMSNEARQSESFLHSLSKVLLPSRGGHNVEWAAHLLGHLSHHHPVEITALFAIKGEGKPPDAAVEALSQQLQRSQGPTPKIKQANSDAVGQTILQEAERGNYDLIVLGATGTQDGKVFTRVIDDVMGSTPCPTMVVRAHPRYEEMKGEVSIRKVLLPAIGTQYSLRAAEVAAVICRSMQATLTVLHVVQVIDGESHGPKGHDLSMAFGNQLVDNHADVARSLGAQVTTLVLQHPSPERCILEYAEENDYDLIFMGLSFRPVGGRAFLGHRAERVLQSAPCAAVVLSSG